MEIYETFKKQAQFHVFEKELAQDKISHAYIIESKDLLSSVYLARLFSLKLNCFEVCYKCPSCLKILNSSHPDVLELPRDGKERILVSDIEEIIENAQLAPMLSKWKIYILNNFDEATESAQNKLLKLLEEPKAGIMFFLNTKNASRILPTVRSRCRQIEAMPFDRETLKRFVKSENAIDFSEGYLGRALELDSKKDFDNICSNVKDLICKLKSSAKVLYHTKFLGGEKKDFLLKLQLLQLFYEDILKIKSEKDIVMKSYYNELKEVASEFSFAAILEIIKLINSSVEYYYSNVSPQIIADNLLVKILEVKYICK